MAEILKNRELQIGVMILSFLIVFVPYFVNIPSLEVASTKLITITARATTSSHFLIASSRLFLFSVNLCDESMYRK